MTQQFQHILLPARFHLLPAGLGVLFDAGISLLAMGWTILAYVIVASVSIAPGFRPHAA